MGIKYYAEGEVIGPSGCKYIKELDPVFYRSREGSKDFRESRMKRKALFECPFCAMHFECMINKIQTGKTKSCGCYSKTQDGLAYIGNQETPLHWIWRTMLSRCSNPNNKNYKHYGGRGISVCQEWQQSFVNFYKWALSNGYDQGLQIDRKNNNGNYEPSNCRFVTCQVNQSNKRTNRYCVLDNSKITVAEAARRLGLSHSTVLNWYTGLHPNKFPERLSFLEFEGV